MNHAVWTALAPLEPGLSRKWDTLSGGVHGLGDLDRVRAERGADVARFVSLQVELRSRAKGRLDVDRLPFLTSKGAEQATPAAVARFRAGRFAARGDGFVPWDACCGVGSDLVALAERFDAVLATDRDPDTLRCAAANLAYAGDREPGVEAGRARGHWAAAVADAGRPPIGPEGADRVLALLDPDRRPRGRREGRPERWDPPLDVVLDVARGVAGACVKLPPGLSAEALETDGRAESSLIWTSLDGELKELSLWTGRLAGEGRCAVALRSSGAEASYAATPLAPPAAAGAGDAVHAAWLVELDVAVWQAGLAGAFGQGHGLAPLAGGGPGGFLIAASPVDHPMARCWPILGTAPGDRRRVRALLREHDVGALVVKTRNHPDTAEALSRSYRGAGSREGLLAVTRVEGRTLAFLLGRPPGHPETA